MAGAASLQFQRTTDKGKQKMDVPEDLIFQLQKALDEIRNFGPLCSVIITTPGGGLMRLNGRQAGIDRHPSSSSPPVYH